MKYRRIRSLTRGIDVLRYLNTVSGAHPVDISKELGLPRPTIHRILETLHDLELVYQGAYSREFRLTPGVRRLTAGGDRFQSLRNAAWPIMRELTSDLVWPSDLAVFEQDSMLIVESTHRLSPLSSDIGVIGQSRSMLVSPLGRAFLSHSQEEDREAILTSLRAVAKPETPLINDQQAIDRILETGARQGFSMCEDMPHDRHASMAVPVRQDEKVIACLNLVWRISDVTFEEARHRFAQPLIAASVRIETRLREAAPEVASSEKAGRPGLRLSSAYTKRTESTSFDRRGPQALASAVV